jgi:hypothetical protein
MRKVTYRLLMPCPNLYSCSSQAHRQSRAFPHSSIPPRCVLRWAMRHPCHPWPAPPVVIQGACQLRPRHHQLGAVIRLTDRTPTGGGLRPIRTGRHPHGLRAWVAAASMDAPGSLHTATEAATPLASVEPKWTITTRTETSHHT